MDVVSGNFVLKKYISAKFFCFLGNMFLEQIKYKVMQIQFWHVWFVTLLECDNAQAVSTVIITLISGKPTF